MEAVESMDIDLETLSESETGSAEYDELEEKYIFVDVIGFFNRQHFICKEFSLIDGDYKYHAIIKPPYSMSKIPINDRQMLNWEIKHLHGLKYDDGDVFLLDVIEATYSRFKNKKIIVENDYKGNALKYIFRNCGEFNFLNIAKMGFDLDLQCDDSYTPCGKHGDILDDIESILVPRDNPLNIAGSKTPKGAFQEHIPNSIAYYFHSRIDPNLSQYESFYGEDCIDQFIQKMEFLMRNIVWPKIHEIKPMALTEEEENDFKEAYECHICKKGFNDKWKHRYKKVRDHCHLTSRYRGAAHSKSNAFPGKMTIIPKNSEHYISFSKQMPNYNDSENMEIDDSEGSEFLQCSLAKLAESLPTSSLKITRSQWANLNEEHFQLLTKKGVYPYSYIDSWEKLNEPKLPAKELFYDELNDSEISDEQYSHAQNVWNTFNIRTLQEYTKIYLKTDVLLLADIFENFRDNCIKLYGLDPAHYYTLPGYSWDCMLKYTNVEIELLTDIDKLMFVERGLRGGISQCSNRHCEANNKYLGADYDPEKPSNYIMYFDVNNLYGWAMSQALPISDFIWNEDNYSSVEEIEQEIMNTPDDATYGSFLEVDLEYPENLHDKHNCYPFCAEHMNVGDSAEERLVLTLHNKKNYIIHYRMLKLALKHGLKLKKVHRILEFKQSKWLEDYIMLNTHERAKSKTEFEKNLFKLMNNAVFGKTMENIRKRVDIKLINKWDGRYGMKILVARPNFKRVVVFNENLVACELQRLNVFMTKPVIVGAAILEISKCKMYEFHYDFILQKFDYEHCQIQYTDTDSFLYNFICEDAYEFIRENKEKFDTSDFPPNNPYHIQQFNKKVLGVMKDEYSGEIIKEFIGLRSKICSETTVTLHIFNQMAISNHYKPNQIYEYGKKQELCTKKGFNYWLVEITRSIWKDDAEFNSFIEGLMPGTLFYDGSFIQRIAEKMQQKLDFDHPLIKSEPEFLETLNKFIKLGLELKTNSVVTNTITV
ncbi:uncharacterized protein LOC116347343 [Contarinia nasturtii]|uniref:uncharacterized protein LOC116347343 n=1 Tax=Contarinia nasturtii TaxID=265458 RepID=UPI0012D474F3|nr:uncharacterized protein LOC116347343 [Contarinia nasturtii]